MMSKKTSAGDEAPAATAGHEIAAASRLHGVDAHQRLIVMPLRALLHKAPVCAPPTASIREAATLMREHGVSSLMLVEGDRLVGIVTDRDLRNRVLAAGVGSERAIADFATPEPLTVTLQATAFDAMLLMARHDVHHIPVLDGTRVAGMVTATDVAEQQGSSAVVLASEIHAQDSLEGLVRTSGRIRDLQRSLAAADATAYATGHVVTAITDALTSRLLQLSEAQLGPPPVAYAWVAAGSQARSEQTAKSDQDNCMILADEFDQALHGAYFQELSRQVCTGLDACGYVFCPGEMMAMTDSWRQPRHRWSDYFQRWIDQPDPKALMHTCVFFDLRLVSGSAALLEGVSREALQLTRGKSLFLAHMVRNALSRQPPLGLFGTIQTARRSGQHRGTIDLKMHGVVPIVDLARIYALAGGHSQVNTHDRLEVAAQSSEISKQSARDLRDVLEYLSALRIVHQARQMDAGEPADNLLTLEELSNFERTQLKNAFKVVQGLQEVLGQRYLFGSV
jgi:CBS domain-containing protein